MSEVSWGTQRNSRLILINQARLRNLPFQIIFILSYKLHRPILASLTRAMGQDGTKHLSLICKIFHIKFAFIDVQTLSTPSCHPLPYPVFAQLQLYHMSYERIIL